MGMDLGSMMKIMGAWNTFKGNHPKFPAFCEALQKRGLEENSIVEIIVTTPEGEKIETSIKVMASDLELVKGLSQLGK